MDSRDEQGIGCLDKVRAPDLAYVNFGMTCSEFYSYVLSDNILLNAAASGQKYY